MKRLFAAALLALTSIAFGATTTPVSLINPAGSTAGQAIISSGPSTAPAWGAVPLTGISGTLAIANGGTGATSAVNALTNLGAAPLAGATFTGNIGVSKTTGEPDVNISGPTGQNRVLALQTLGSARWKVAASTVAESGSNAGSNFFIGRYDDTGTFIDSPISIVRSTGVVTYTAIPVQPTPSTADNSTNSATTAYVVAKLASPTAIGSTAPAAGTFTTLKGSNSKVIASTTNAQSIPNNAFTQITTFTASLNQGSNFVASTGIYTAPSAGTYDVRAAFTFNALAAGAVGQQIVLGVFVNGTVVQKTMPITLQTTTSVQSGIEGVFRVNCAASDVITIQVYHNLGSSLVLSGAAQGNWLSIEQEP